MFADAIVIPVCPSMFDRESAAMGHAEMGALPRVASGRCRIGAVGMRIDGRTNGAQVLRDWAGAIGVPLIGTLRETQLYSRAIERGLTMFDLPSAQAASDLAQWQPVLDWLTPVLAPAAANDAPPRREAVMRIAASRPEALMPAQDSLVHGTRLAGMSAARVEHQPVLRTLEGSRTRVPQFLKR